MGYFTCKSKCLGIKKVSRLTKGRKRCNSCSYYTITEKIFCPCCGRKYKIRKTGQNKRNVVRMT